MMQKRAGWLAALFLGEMLTATAMGYFEDEIARAVVLALFVPLIISSGGNSGSQATTLVIRAMALGEVRLRDWWRVVRREILAGLALGCILGDRSASSASCSGSRLPASTASTIVLVALTVAGSLVGVVHVGHARGLDAALPAAPPRASTPPAPRRRSSRRSSTSPGSSSTSRVAHADPARHAALIAAGPRLAATQTAWYTASQID